MAGDGGNTHGGIIELEIAVAFLVLQIHIGGESLKHCTTNADEAQEGEEEHVENGRCANLLTLSLILGDQDPLKLKDTEDGDDDEDGHDGVEEELVSVQVRPVVHGASRRG